MSAMFAVYHGPEGLKEIAGRVHSGTLLLAKGLREDGNDLETKVFFDTIKVKLKQWLNLVETVFWLYRFGRAWTRPRSSTGPAR